MAENCPLDSVSGCTMSVCMEEHDQLPPDFRKVMTRYPSAIMADEIYSMIAEFGHDEAFKQFKLDALKHFGY